MDTLILGGILATFVVVVRDGSRQQVILVWAVCLVAALLLFRHHVTSSLDLNF